LFAYSSRLFGIRFFNESVPFLTSATFTQPLRALMSALPTKKSRFDFTHVVKVDAIPSIE
jgi:hypothetical protein